MDRFAINKSIPCYGCEERSEGCHSTCERYVEFRKGQEKKYADKEKNKAIREYASAQKTKVIRYKKYHK